MALDNEEIQKLLAKFKDLPTLPDVVARVMRIVSNPLTTADDLNQVISLDQALTFKVLRLANSAYYAFPQEITNITQAVTILGFNTVRNLALSVSVHKMLFGGSERALFSPRQFWRHCVRTAVAARILALRVKYKSDENAFTAGLLHDIGKNILDKVQHDEFLKCLQASIDNSETLWRLETRAIGVDHAMLGGLLAEKWNLPGDLREAIAKHHVLDDEVAPDVLVAVVHAANELSRGIEAGSGDLGTEGINPVVRDMLRLQPADEGRVKEEIEAAMKEAEAFLRIPRRP